MIPVSTQAPARPFMNTTSTVNRLMSRRSAKTRLFSGVHVPCFILSPDVAAGARSDTTGSVDLFATILALAGVAGPAGDGRDLRLPGVGVALGMRRSYTEPYAEPRIGGPGPLLTGHRFYAARGDVLITGDSGQVRLEQEELVRQAESMRTTFADFEQQFVDAEFAEHVDPDSGAALHALGYAR